MNKSKKFGVLDANSKEMIKEMEDMLKKKYDSDKGTDTPDKGEKEIA